MAPFFPLIPSGICGMEMSNLFCRYCVVHYIIPPSFLPGFFFLFNLTQIYFLLFLFGGVMSSNFDLENSAKMHLGNTSWEEEEEEEGIDTRD